MWTAVGDTLPLAAGLALSPVALITGIVLLLGPSGRMKAAMFGLGWLIAIFVIALIAYGVVDATETADPDLTSEWMSCS
jgi:ABC-type uncharacterized transport system fused permease/ATPase subunit